MKWTILLLISVALSAQTPPLTVTAPPRVLPPSVAPHIASASVDTRRTLEGRRPANLLNPELWK